MAASDQPIMLILKRTDIEEEEIQFRVRPSTQLQRIISSYAFNCNVNEHALHIQTKGGKRVAGTDSVQGLELEDGAELLVRLGPFSPFRPSHADHSDMGFDVDGHSFLMHKFPVLKSASPLLKDMVDEYDGDPVPLHVPGGAQVFDTVARFLYKDEVNAARLFSFSNAASVRVAASFLQFDALAVAVDAFLDTKVLPFREPCLAVLHAAMAVPAAEAPENGVVQRCVRAVSKLVQWRRLAALAADVVAGVEAEQTDKEASSGNRSLVDGPASSRSDDEGGAGRKPWRWAVARLPALSTLLSGEAAAEEEEEEARRAKTVGPSSWPSGYKPATASAVGRVSGEGGRCEALLMRLPPRLFLLAAAAAREHAVAEAGAASRDAEAAAAGRTAVAEGEPQASVSASAAAGAMLRRADKAMGVARAVSVAAALFVLYRLAAATAADIALLMSGQEADTSPALAASTFATDSDVVAALGRIFGAGGAAWPDHEALPPASLADLRLPLPAHSGNSSDPDTPVLGRQARWRALHDCADIIRLVDATALPPAVALRLLRLVQAAGAPALPDASAALSQTGAPASAKSVGERVAAAASAIRAICGVALASSPGSVLALPRSTLASLEPAVMAEALGRARDGAPARRQLLRAYWTARLGCDPEHTALAPPPLAMAIPGEPGAVGTSHEIVHESSPGLTLEELSALLRAAKPHFGAPPGLTVASGGAGMEEDAEDDLDGDAGSGFYTAALGVILDAVARHESELQANLDDDVEDAADTSRARAAAETAIAERELTMQALQRDGLLRLDLLPPRTLRAAMGHPGVPQRPVADAALVQSEAVAAQLAATQAQLRRMGEALRESRAREGLCEHSHLPILTGVSVLRSSGQWTLGRVQAFSAHTGLYAIEYGRAYGRLGPGEQRWYDLTRTRYRVEADHETDPALGAADASESGSQHVAADSARVPAPAPQASPRLEQPLSARQRGSVRTIVPPLPLPRQPDAASAAISSATLSVRADERSRRVHVTPRRDAATLSSALRRPAAHKPSTAIGGAGDKPGAVAHAWPADAPEGRALAPPVTAVAAADPGTSEGDRDSRDAVAEDSLSASQRAGALIRGTGGPDAREGPPGAAPQASHRPAHSGPLGAKAGKRVWGAEQQLARLERAQRGQQIRLTAAASSSTSAAARRQAEVSAQINARAAAELASRDLRREAAFAADEAEAEANALAASARAGEASGPMSGRTLREAARYAMQSTTAAPAQRRSAARR